MQITFKNVGQGDSIILEWQSEGSQRIGIIDCKKYNNRNRIIEHISEVGYNEIEFLILSHPHSDHFSGMNELLEYCDENSISIKRLLHTRFTEPKYLRSAVKGYEADAQLAKLFKSIHDKRQSQLIKYQTFVYDEIRSFSLNEEIELEFISPSTIEFEKFNRQTYTKSEENRDSCSHGNWISTVIKISSVNWFILLTSDAGSKSLKRIFHNNREKIQGTLILCQAPHHGARKNHSNELWRNLSTNNSKCVISVGENNYDHPSSHVIKKFEDFGYDIFTTQLPDNKSKQSQEIEIKDNLLSNIGAYDELDDSVNNNKFSGDKSFKIVNNEAVYSQ